MGDVGPDHFAAVAGNMVDGRADNSAAFVATAKAGERSTAPQVVLQECVSVQCSGWWSVVVRCVQVKVRCGEMQALCVTGSVLSD